MAEKTEIYSPACSMHYPASTRAGVGVLAAGVLAACLLLAWVPRRARPVQLAGGYYSRQAHDYNPGLPTSPLDPARYKPLRNAATMPLSGQPRQWGANADTSVAQQQSRLQQGPVALDLDGGDMPMPFDDNNPFPVVPGSNIDMFGHYGTASPRDNPCARYGANAMYYCDRRSGRCGCVASRGAAVVNGEAPGDLWNPAVGRRHAQLGFIGGSGIEGGQGNSDSIYGSHDDHSTYGIFGSGWQGPGNGEAPGDLWNPAVGRRQGSLGQKRLAADGTDGVTWFGGNLFEHLFKSPAKPRLAMGDLPIPIGYDGDRDRIVPGSNIHM